MESKTQTSTKQILFLTGLKPFDDLQEELTAAFSDTTNVVILPDRISRLQTAFSSNTQVDAIIMDIDCVPNFSVVTNALHRAKRLFPMTPILGLSKDFDLATEDQDAENRAISLLSAGLDMGQTISDKSGYKATAERIKTLLLFFNNANTITSPQTGNDSFKTQKVNDLIIDHDAKTVRYGNRCITPAKSVFSCLSILAGKPDVVFSRRQLMDRIHGQDKDVDERTIDCMIKRTRQALRNLGMIPSPIKTIYCIGYKLESEKLKLRPSIACTPQR